MYLPGTHYDLIIEIPDYVNGTTRWKRKVLFQHFGHDILKGVTSLKMVTWRQVFADHNGAYGPALDQAGVPDKQVDLVGDNDCLVDATTGQILATRGDGSPGKPRETTEQWDSLIAELSAERDTKLQGDWFADLAAGRLPFSNHEAMYRANIIQAYRMGKYD